MTRRRKSIDRDPGGRDLVKRNEKPASYVQLHVHSDFSLAFGAIRIDELVKRAKALGHTALALTDSGNMFGAIEFYRAAKAHGLKPILGAEVYHGGQELTHAVRRSAEPVRTDPTAFQLVVLAKSTLGYHSVARMISYGYLDHPELVLPIVSEDRIDQNTADIIALSGGLTGEFGYLVERLTALSSDPIRELNRPSRFETEEVVAALNNHVLVMAKRFGKDNYYIELVDNNLPDQKRMLPIFAAVAQRFNLPLVATSNAFYFSEDDREAHAVLTAIRNETTLAQIRNRFHDTRFHLLSNEEMEQVYGQWPSALENTTRIADQCQVELKFGKVLLPKFDLADGENEDEALKRMARQGLIDRMPRIESVLARPLTSEEHAVYDERLDYELDLIIKMGFPRYFLIVQDYINWAKQNDIPVGPGRGAAASSLVAYALGITNLDPIPFNLIFERFMNPERESIPDFDVDFCQIRRHEVIAYVTRKYGAENVARITSFGKFKAKNAIRGVGCALEVDDKQVDRIAKLVPNDLGIKLVDALVEEPQILEEAKKDELIDKMIKLALKIEGLRSHPSVHDTGVIISEGGLENYVPVYRTPVSSLITQYEMKYAEQAGLANFDFLGLKALTVIHKAQKSIQSHIRPDFHIDDISLTDTAVYQNISSGNLAGIFQLEKMRDLIAKFKPSRFEDIIAIIALFRPGLMHSGMADDFIVRKHGRQNIEYLLPELRPILEETYGVILYQEQVQQIAATLANYSLGEADLLRRAMGKRFPEDITRHKARFKRGCSEKNITENVADDLFELMARVAFYTFNKSHSAAYGLISYQTAYLKTHYPEEFMAALVECEVDGSD